MNLTIIGTGYVGLVTGACFAELGNKVTCLDINPAIIGKLKQSKVSFYEPGLEELVKINLDKKNLSFTTSYKTGCKNNIFFICVDTPDNGRGAPNLKSLNSVVKKLKEEIQRDAIIILKSLKIPALSSIADAPAAELYASELSHPLLGLIILKLKSEKLAITLATEPILLPS